MRPELLYSGDFYNAPGGGLNGGALVHGPGLSVACLYADSGSTVGAEPLS